MLEDILSAFFPERCIGCGKRGSALCVQCQSTIRPASFDHDTDKRLSLCTVWDYGNPLVSKAIWQLKYQRKSSAARILTLHADAIQAVNEYLSDILHTPTMQDIVIVPIPQYYTKSWERGFNQSKIIAQWLQKILPHASILNVLQKTRATTAQAHARNRNERLNNLTNSMKAPTILSSRPVYIVVDDVITTGSTVYEASRALRAAGAKHICAIALAHGHHHRHESSV